jgi:hypothetical protein
MPTVEGSEIDDFGGFAQSLPRKPASIVGVAAAIV